jgi:hypothetical protein
MPTGLASVNSFCIKFGYEKVKIMRYLYKITAMKIFWMFCLWLTAMRLGAQPISVTLNLNDPAVPYCDTLSMTDSIFNRLPYSLALETFDRPFTREFFKLFKKGKIKVWRDAERIIPFPYERFKEETFFLNYFLSKNFRKGKKQPSNAEVLPDYRLDLMVLEEWTFTNALNRKVTGGAIFLKDLNKPQFQPTELYFDLNDKAIPYHLLRLRCDYNGDPNANPQTLILESALNFKLASANAPLPMDWEQFVKINYKAGQGITKVNYRIMLPPMYFPTSKDNKPIPVAHLANNGAIFRQVVPQLFRKVLSGKVKCYSVIENDRIIPMKARDIYYLIERHPLNPAPVTKKNIQTIDFSYGIQDLQIGGRLVRRITSTDTLVDFQVDYVGLVWGKNWDDEDKTIITYLQAKDLKPFRVNNQTLIAFLESQPYYYTMARVNNVYPRDFTEANFINHFLRNGNWEGLPHQLDYWQWSEQERYNRNEHLGLISR